MLEFGKREKCFIMNGLVIDIQTGYIFKLGQNKIILKAYHGYDLVSQEILEEKFGSPPVYENFDPYKVRTKEYICCLTYFDCCLSAIVAHMIHYQKQFYRESEINVAEIIQDAKFAEHFNYSNCSKNEYQSVHGFAYFFKGLLEDLDRMIPKQQKIKQILQSLRKRGKILFLASNSVDEYVAVLMEHCFGKDWLELFDLVISSARKPAFFSKDNPFFEVDLNAVYRRGQEISELKPHQVYIRGNAKILEENIMRLNGNKPGRILFFGDNYSTDALAAETIDHWDAVCVMEELGDVDFGEGYDGSYWGHWQYEDTPTGRIPTFWFDYMSKNVAICTSLVGSMDMLKFYELHEL